VGFLDNARDKLTKAVDQHGDKIAQGIDKAAQVANEKTGGKHADKIATASGKARDALDSLDGKNDDIRDTPPAPGTPPSTPEQPGIPTDPTNPATG
jgi:hypothetical protein